MGENGEWNLSGDRYGIKETITSTWPVVPLGQLVKFLSGGTPSKKSQEFWSGPIPWVSPKDMKSDLLVDTEDHISETAIEDSATTVVGAGTVLCVVRSGILKHSLPIAVTAKTMCFNQDIKALVPISDRITAAYLFWVLKGRSEEILAKGIKPGVTVQSFYSKFFENFEIPLPPLDIQKEIVAEIEAYQKIIEGARQVVENYQIRIPVLPDWPMVKLGKQYSTSGGGTPSKSEPNNWTGNVPWVSPKDMKEDVILDTEDHISEAAIEGSSTKQYPAGTVVCVVRSGILKHSFPVAMLSRPMCINQDLIAFIPKDDTVIPQFLFFILKSRSRDILAEGIKPGVTVQSFYNGFFKSYKIPLPDIDTQCTIVAEIEAEQRLVDSNKELIRRFEEKIKQTINRVWGEEEGNHG
ncbi:restriction endonuclease subunit S [Litchfieldella rifensis]|uniref:Restriction endonuclease subunit S n=1 Tax=Litchfieldella rifensis TaxID=762643 RepID=A0ABV7LIF7_9GAMM